VKKKSGLFVLTIFLSGWCFAQDCTLRLTGHIHSTATHENLPQATVQLVESNRNIVTDNNGDFRFDSLCAGDYTIRITHIGYDTTIRRVTLTKTLHLDIDLLPAQHVLKEVTITGTRASTNEGLRKELAGRELEETKGRSLAEALSKLNGVTLLQTGATIAKPVIHGLHSNRLLTINNGIRQEGQQWGNEHAPEIDPFIANRLTVVKGVDELRYGSDAIGGVILVEPRALRTTPGYNAELNAVYATNNSQYTTSAIFEQQLKRLPSFTYRVQATYKKGGNIATPHYRLNNTALEEKNFSFTAAWRKEHFHTELYYSLFNTQAGIFTGAHIGNLTDLRNAIAASRPDPVFTGQKSYQIDRPSQDVSHQLLKWKTGIDVGNSKFNLLLAGQYNQRKEYDVVRNAAAKGAQIDLTIYTFSEELNWEHPKWNNLQGTVGIVASQQDNSYSGRYLIPNYEAYTYGGYAIEKWTKGKWELQAGLRYDDKSIHTSRLQAASNTYTAYDFNFSTLASSFHAGYSPWQQWQIKASASLATRAPHVNELLTNGIHHGAGTYEVGDIHLRPEQSFHIALHNHYTSRSKLFSADLTLYNNRINDYIYQQPVPDEPVLTIRGAFPKIVYRATDALFQGMDLSTKLQFHPRMALASSYALLRARDRSRNDWLIGVPADRITNEVTYTLKDSKTFTNTYFSVEVEKVFRQTRVPDESTGIQDYKAPPDGYALLNADLSTSIKLKGWPLTIGVSGRNLLNTAYRNYLNSFRYYTDEMGRNISLRLKLNLQTLY
jgi:iron complex outermembrane receptor protein